MAAMCAKKEPAKVPHCIMRGRKRDIANVSLADNGQFRTFLFSIDFLQNIAIFLPLGMIGSAFSWDSCWNSWNGCWYPRPWYHPPTSIGTRHIQFFGYNRAKGGGNRDRYRYGYGDYYGYNRYYGYDFY